MRELVFTRSAKPELVQAVMFANLVGCAYQHKDIEEQYRDIKMSAAVGTENGRTI